MRRAGGLDLLGNPSQAWLPYSPSKEAPWDRAAVAHLHRRAGFAASWPTLERDLSGGPEASVARLLAGEPVSLDGRSADQFARDEDVLATRFGGSGNDLQPLQAAWIHRMLFTPAPLRERMTLLWHDHFATSNAKVLSPNLMRRQNDLFRAHALGNFGTLLKEVAHDAAMLIWLDSTTNRKAHPNENFAREVMELFSLGIGHYSEIDVQEAARAFSGTFIQNDNYRQIAAQHDAGTKTILGQTGTFNGDDVPGILLQQPACAEFVCTRLFQYFVSDVDSPSPDLIKPLAAAFRDSSYEIEVPVGLILRSRLFNDPALRRRRVKSPIELAVGTLRSLEIFKPTMPPAELAEATSQMGQGLFAPPSVAGWDWGTSWLNTSTSLARTNFALDVARDAARFKPEELLALHGQSTDPAGFFLELLLQDGADASFQSQLKGDAREVATLALTAPEYQLA